MLAARRSDWTGWRSVPEAAAATDLARSGAWRVEHDLVGDRRLPLEARHGIHADRAVENFGLPDALRVGEVAELARAFGLVKLAALRANVECGVLAGPVVPALEQACRELAEDRGGLRRSLVVPLIQGGAGTSTNMNVNEVLANRALELLGLPHGAYAHCHPNDHVNRSQSTNDTYPTALRLALVDRGARLERAVAALVAALRRRGAEHADVRKLGRTQLQDAVPISVGDEFAAWADAHEAAGTALAVGHDALLEVNLGGTAVGTGLTTPPGYREAAVRHLTELTGLPLRSARRGVSATTDTSALLLASSSLRAVAIALGKLANDLRLLSSGPRGGLGELHLPPVQGGSSMMPGKVNPVIPEYANQVAFRVRGADATVALALDAGQLQLHAMLPVAAHELLIAQAALTSAVDAVRTRCIDGLEVDVERVRALARAGLDELSEIAATEGYALATRLAVADADTDTDTDTDGPPPRAPLTHEDHA